jgi:hypothetical protein
MTKYLNTVVTKEFIEYRNKKAIEFFNQDIRHRKSPTEKDTRRRADFLWPEYYLAMCISEKSGHKLNSNNRWDTNHAKIWGSVEFKYCPLSRQITVGPWCTQQQFDNFCFWTWNKPGYPILVEGESVDFETLEYIDRLYVASRINKITNKFDYNNHVQIYKTMV